MAAVEATKAKKRSLKKMVQPHEFGGPAKPKSGFFLFSDKHRDGVTDAIRKALKPDEKFNVASVASKLGEMWKAEPEASKAAFNKQGEELKAKHDTEMEQWKLTDNYKKFIHASALHQKKKADKKATMDAKASGMPQRPMAGYMIFGNEIRPAVKADIEKSGEKFTVQLSAAKTKERWVALGEEGQKPYNEKYQVAKAKYDEELKAWEETDAGKAFKKAKAGNAKRKQQSQKVGRKAKRAKKDDDAEDDDEDPEVSDVDDEEGEEESPDEE